MKTELRTVGTEIHFGRIIPVTYLTYEPEKIKGGKIVRADDDGQFSVEAPAVAVRLNTSRYGKGFLDGFFRLNEANDWDPCLSILGFDGDFVDEYGSFYLADSFVAWDEGMQHHRIILEEMVQKFARYAPRIGETQYWRE